jgi:hypothetical protein
LTAPARAAVRKRRVGDEETALRSNKETDERREDALRCRNPLLLGVHSRYGLHTRAVTVFRDTLSEGFSHFVTSIAAPAASGWSGCRVGLTPTGKRRLSTAHGQSGQSFLIVDRGPAHIAKKTKAFVATLGSRLKLFYLPTYSPDRNPDELVWKHLKADTVGRMVTTSKADFKSKVLSSKRSLQKKSVTTQVVR